MILLGIFENIHQVREALDKAREKGALLLDIQVPPYLNAHIYVDIWTPKKSLPNTGFRAMPNPLLKKALDAAIDRLNEKERTEDNLQAIWNNRGAVIAAYKRGAFRQ